MIGALSKYSYQMLYAVNNTNQDKSEQTGSMEGLLVSDQ